MPRKIKPFYTELEITDVTTEGLAVGRHNGQVVFIEDGVPGDLAKVFVHGTRRRVLNARVEEVIRPSEVRVQAPCEHFGLCGGCKWQNMDYAAQLRYKQKFVEDVFERIAKVEPQEVRPILPAPEPYAYRNKVEFSFSDSRWLTPEEISTGREFDRRALGFHKPKAHDKILDIQYCHLTNAPVNEIRNALKAFAIEKNIPFYNAKEHTGFLRQVVFRNSLATGELMILLIVAEDKLEIIDSIFNHLAESFPAISSFTWMVNPKLNNSFGDLSFREWRGKPFIVEELGGHKFRIAPTSFFQTNPRQAERLYQVVWEHLRESLPVEKEKFEVVYDLYSGTGSIGIFVSDLAKKVVGMEYVQSAIDDAWENVRLNDLESQFSFHAGDLKLLLTPEMMAAEGKPEVVITDPPRAGMDPKVVQRLLEMAPQHLIYVSCNPGTQARDVGLLAEKYELLRIQPVDMFPQTAHVENVAWLKLR